jgi:L-ascorbate metabolism protein UlaG (beta-lactamase superfamily)
VGDADAEAEELPAHGLEKRAIDVALVPYWWLGDAASLARVRQRLGVRHVVAIHVPPDEVAEVKQRMAALDPELLLFERPGEARKLSLSPARR